MTDKEWFTRSRKRIYDIVRRSGRIGLRNLKRATHYNRGPADEGIGLWHDALDDLEKRGKIRFNRDEYGNVVGDIFSVPVTTDVKQLTSATYKDSTPKSSAVTTTVTTNVTSG